LQFAFSYCESLGRTRLHIAPIKISGPFSDFFHQNHGNGLTFSAVHFKLLNQSMKTKNTNIIKSITLAAGISTLAALPLLAGVGVGVNINVPAPVVVAPAPPPVVVTTVPDSYVWDGTEYVGVVGSQYYYLGAGNVWLTMDGPRLERWHKWEAGHGDWRTHTIRNERYRHDAHGHEVPFHENHGHDDHNDHGHDNDHDHNH
jgi:hypothetical protein